MSKKIAIISDIHGNIWALEEVLKDIRNKKIDLILNLGDSLYGSLDPAGCANILMYSNIISILGNEDAIFLEENVNVQIHKSYNFTINSLEEKHIKWLRSLETTKSIYNKIFLCHGISDDYNQYFIEDVSNGFPMIKSKEHLTRLTKGIKEDIIVCGHSHLPNTVRINEKIIINPGSVGIQAYVDNTPNYHKMESGSPHARYSIIELIGNDINIENILIQYDWNRAAKIASQNGRADWSEWIKTGRIS